MFPPFPGANDVFKNEVLLTDICQTPLLITPGSTLRLRLSEGILISVGMSVFVIESSVDSGTLEKERTRTL